MLHLKSMLTRVMDPARYGHKKKPVTFATGCIQTRCLKTW
jgi:hypothetical protein